MYGCVGKDMLMSICACVYVNEEEEGGSFCLFPSFIFGKDTLWLGLSPLGFSVN